MPFSYGKFLESLSLTKGRRGSQRGQATSSPTAPRTGQPAGHPQGDATVAANALWAQAAALPEMQAPRAQPGSDAAEQMEKLLACLWRMSDNLTQIRSEFRLPGTNGHTDPSGFGSASSSPDEEPGGVMAQVDALERTICSIATAVAGSDRRANSGNGAPALINDDAARRHDALHKTVEAVRQLRLQAVQLATAVHLHRSALALTHSAIARARR